MSLSECDDRNGLVGVLTSNLREAIRPRSTWWRATAQGSRSLRQAHKSCAIANRKGQIPSALAPFFKRPLVLMGLV